MELVDRLKEISSIENLYRINLDLLKRVRKKNNRCLCKLNVLCPCSELENLDIYESCTCKVFERWGMKKDELEDSQGEQPN